MDYKDFDKYLQSQQFILWVALNKHRTHKNRPLTLINHYYLKEVLMDNNPFRVIKKSTQCGVSEALIIMSFCMADKGNSVLYVLPTEQLKNRFVNNRYEKSIMNTAYYRQSMGSKDAIDNKSMKDIGKGMVYFAGSKSDVPFVEMPADCLIIDEVDVCDKERLAMAEERLGHTDNPQVIRVGNPTVVNSMLDEYWEDSSKSIWHIKCEHCNTWAHPDFFEHVIQQVDEGTFVIRDEQFSYESMNDIRMVCSKCGKYIDRFAMGEYVSEREHKVSGKHISRLFSGTGTILEIVKHFSDGLKNSIKLQRFYNSDLGLNYSEEGAKISAEMLNECKEEYIMPSGTTAACVAGIDVGSNINILIGEVLAGNTIRLVHAAEIPISKDGQEEKKTLLELFRQYNVKFHVVDSMPEMRFSRWLVTNWQGCDCNLNSTKREFNFNKITKTVSQMRTPFLDNVKESLLLKQVILPINAENIKNFYPQMTSSTRIWDEDREEFVWTSGSKPDHYMFAFGYMLLARRLLALV